MNVRENWDLNGKVRDVLKKLDVKWRDGGECIRTANKLTDILTLAVKDQHDRDQATIAAIKELVE